LDARLLLDLAEEFQSSEHVSGAAFAALFEVSRELKLSDDVVQRLRSLSEAFFERWPESSVVQRDRCLKHQYSGRLPP
jgi:hypothetical protein